MSCMTMLFLNLQITRSDIRSHIVGCQPGDCIWSLQCSSGVCVGTYGLTYSLTKCIVMCVHLSMCTATIIAVA